MVSKVATVSGAPLGVLRQRAGRALLWLQPNGWQARARRNAWAAMVADRQHRSERVAADREMRMLISAAGLQVRAH